MHLVLKNEMKSDYLTAQVASYFSLSYEAVEIENLAIFTVCVAAITLNAYHGVSKHVREEEKAFGGFIQGRSDCLPLFRNFHHRANV